MKAKYLAIIALGVSGLTSCNMDLAPVGQLEESVAIQSTNDARRFRNGFYTGVRSLCSSEFITAPEIQANLFNGLTINGNRMGTWANGDILSADSDILTYWAWLYTRINNINYFLERTQPLYEKAVADNDVEAAREFERYIGEAHFFRGYYYAEMFDRWCTVYSPEKGDQEGLGLPIVTIYNPTADRSSYPGRSSMNQTLKFINDELNAAHQALMLFEETADPQELAAEVLCPNAIYVSHYTVEAMQARLALWTGDWNTAVSKAQSVISAGIWTICSRDNYEAMWKNDTGSEIIFQPYESSVELSGSLGGSWIGAYQNQADYIAAPELIKSLMVGYDKRLKRGDIRFSTYLQARNLTTTFGTVGSPCFVKFPGNPALMTSSTPNIVNKPKVFRLSEMYLILAEASYRNNDATTANSALKTIYENRYKGTTYTDKTGSDIFDEVVLQRTLELVGEGFRISDLRRWKMGFTRSGNYTGIDMADIANASIPNVLTPAGLEVFYQTDDHRYTWPIPSSEIEVNPQLVGQQNPGY